MPLLFWDASALAKRYTLEIGSDTADALFAVVPQLEMASTVWGYAETYSILLRKLNDGRLDFPTFATSVTALQAEVIDNPSFDLLTIDDAAILAGIPLMRKHNINSADAAILAVFLRFVQAQAPSGQSHVLVAADKRLVRAAQAENLITIDPELLLATDVPVFLANL